MQSLPVAEPGTTVKLVAAGGSRHLYITNINGCDPDGVARASFRQQADMMFDRMPNCSRHTERIFRKSSAHGVTWTTSIVITTSSIFRETFFLHANMCNACRLAPESAPACILMAHYAPWTCTRCSIRKRLTSKSCMRRPSTKLQNTARFFSRHESSGAGQADPVYFRNGQRQ